MVDLYQFVKPDPVLRAEDLEGAPRSVTISEVEVKDFGKGLIFVGIEERPDKRLRLTDKMAATLKQAVEEGRFPRDTNEWGGLVLELHPESFMNNEGEVVLYIRIEIPVAEEVAAPDPQQTPEPEPTPEPESPVQSEIPEMYEPGLDATEDELDAAIGGDDADQALPPARPEGVGMNQNVTLIGAERCFDAGLALALSETQNEKLRGPREKGWNQNPISREALQQKLSNGSTGYAIITGELSGDVVAIDADSVEASRIVDLFIPDGPSWGRTVDGETLTRATLVRCRGAKFRFYRKDFELLADGRAIDGPGSLHYQTKEPRFPIRSFDEHPIPELTCAELNRRLDHMSAALLLGDAWSMLSRNSATMALSACLYRAGVTRDEAERILRAVMILSEDNEPDNRLDVLKRTYDAGGKDSPITSEAESENTFGGAIFKTLNDLIGFHDPAKILGVKPKTPRKKAEPLPKIPGTTTKPKTNAGPKAKPASDPEPKAKAEKGTPEPLSPDDPFKKPLIPLDVYVPPIHPYDPEGLSPTMLKTAEAVAQACKCELSFAANSICAIAEFVASMYYDIELPWTSAIVPANTFRMSFLESGERKTEVERMVRQGIRDAEQALEETYETRKKEYAAKKQAYDEMNRAMKKGLTPKNLTGTDKGKSDDESEDQGEDSGSLNDQRDVMANSLVELEEPVPPQLPRLTSGDATVEGLHKALKRGYRVMALISGDAGTFLGGYSMRENLIYALSKYSDVWSMGEFDRDRASDDDPERLHNVRLGIHWMVQPEVAKEFITAPIANEQGFLPRVLSVFPEPQFGKHGGLERYKATDNKHIKAWRDLIRHYAHPENWSYSLEDEERRNPIRTTLRVTDAAISELDTLFRDMGKRASDDNDLKHIKAFAARGCENALRVAAGFLVIEHGTKESELDVDMVRPAVRQVRWHIDEWARIKGLGGDASEHIEDASKVLEWLKAKGKHRFSARELSQYGPYCIQSKGMDTRDQLIETLQRHRYIKLIGEAEVDGKRRLNVFDVHPEIFKT